MAQGSPGDYPKALEWYNKALVIFENKLGKEHPYTASVYEAIADINRRIKSQQA
jgi:hypothetical protein